MTVTRKINSNLMGVQTEELTRKINSNLMAVQTEELTRKINSNLMGKSFNKSPGLLKKALASLEICWQKAEWQHNQKNRKKRLTVFCSFALVLMHIHSLLGESLWRQYLFNFVCSYRTLSSRSTYRVSRRSWRISRNCCARPGQCSGQCTARVALWSVFRTVHS